MNMNLLTNPIILNPLSNLRRRVSVNIDTSLKDFGEDELKALALFVFQRSWEEFAKKPSDLDSLLNNVVGRVICHQVIMRDILKERLFSRLYSVDDPNILVQKFLKSSELGKPIWNIFKTLAFLCEYRLYKTHDSDTHVDLDLYWRAFVKGYEQYIRPYLPRKITFEDFFNEAITDDSLACYKTVRDGYMSTVNKFYEPVDLNKLKFNDIKEPDAFLYDPIKNITNAFTEVKTTSPAKKVR